jgi:hypothetical protein
MFYWWAKDKVDPWPDEVAMQADLSHLMSTDDGHLMSTDDGSSQG